MSDRIKPGDRLFWNFNLIKWNPVKSPSAKSAVNGPSSIRPKNTSAAHGLMFKRWNWMADTYTANCTGRKTIGSDNATTNKRRCKRRRHGMNCSLG